MVSKHLCNPSIWYQTHLCNNELARLQMRFDRARSDVIVWVSAGQAGLGGDTDRHT